ncbi:SusC/RagA family TonB-linked outer membrane protein [Fulvivirgaceae bacterium BMA12]|uniref:SusC/RagA family TonB-linked outer membrane protein n=1 Tax=Agaribacillus aureus TaxID=3051825 RepID=A0ABT8L7I9_9BACT|nr:SusC/RagA family TonB-linked outer membrane protein [Fulvivirgaceae bacterium BMA12]
MKNCLKRSVFLTVRTVLCIVLIQTIIINNLVAGESKDPKNQRKDITITGKVTDASTGIELPFVAVTVKNTNIGQVTDVNGDYRITVPEDAEALIFSFVGYLNVEEVIGNRTVINVQLKENVTSLDEVVVTALGVEREQKALGYAVQEVQGSELTEARETNVVNSLSGKVAGVQVVGGSSGVGSTALITIRGESSLIPGQNSPLFVVDGIPINNRTVSNRTEGNLETDFGNGAQDINPDDIESISVLKGPNATALYGSRGANGVILVTTKSGKGSQGFRVDINQNVTFEEPLRIPRYQNQYGQGAGGEFAFGDGFGAGINDNIDESWGPRFNGQPIVQHNSPTSSGVRAGDFALRPRDENGNFTDEATPLPWTASPDNIEDFFRTGYTTSTNVALSGSNEQGNFRTAYTRMNSEGILPNTDYKRENFALSGSYQLTDKVKVTSSLNYVNSSSGNRPNNSYGTENIMYLWVWFGRQIDMSTLRDYWQPGLEGVQQFNYNYNWHDNPYFTMYENTNSFNKDRLFGNVRLDFEITDELSLMVRSGLDLFNDLRIGKRAFSTQRFDRGQYREDDIYFKEQNTDFLLSYNKKLNGDFQLGASLGGNLRREENRYKRISANALSVPGIFNFGNAAEPLSKNQFNDEKEVQSLYGFLNLSYKNILFLDVTGRNDWSSTLPESDNSYFYPSVGLSAIISDMVDLPPVFSFAKLRAGWAIVGNDTDPYALINTFKFEEPFGNVQQVSASETLKNSNLKPEESNSIEVGADIRLFKGRLGLDVTYYKANTKNQILTLPVSITSGYKSRIINAGEIENQGLEIMLNGQIVQSPSGFSWTSSFNFTRNRGKVKELIDDLDVYTISNNYVEVQARVGGRVGDVYGTGFATVEDENSQFFGQVIHNEDGFAVRDPTLKNLGNYNPDFMLGFQNTFTYKNISLGVLFDWRHGGVVNSRTVLIGGTSGMMDFTAEGREEGIISEGVIDNGDGTYRVNDVRLSGRDFYWWRYNRGNEEVGMFDASFLKLREVKLGYSLPQTLIERTPFKALTISVVGRNLALWTENPHFDPETLSFNGGTIVPGVEDMATPSSRSMGFNLNITF